jgi:hypothetical protein
VIEQEPPQGGFFMGEPEAVSPMQIEEMPPDEGLQQV